MRILAHQIFFVSILTTVSVYLGTAQAVFTVEYKSQADVVLYEVQYKSQADIVVFKADYKSELDPEKGVWFDVSYKSQADWIVYWADYASEADCKVYFAQYKSEASRNTCYLDNKMQQSRALSGGSSRGSRPWFSQGQIPPGRLPVP